MIDLMNILWDKKNLIEEFIKKYEESFNPMIYNSIDLRFSGYKATTVDTNIFPAGFKNLSQNGVGNLKMQLIEFIKKIEKQIGRKPKKTMIIAESHTRNEPYMQGVMVLKNTLEEIGLDVKIATIRLSDIEIDVENTHTKNIEKIEMFRLMNEHGYLTNKDRFRPDFAILNDDLTAGVPDSLKFVRQPVLPNISNGWYNNKKSDYFDRYNKIASDFAKYIDIDSWLVSAYFDKLENFELKDDDSLLELKNKVDNIIDKIQKKYNEYNITEKPKVFIKSDRGTYGLGIISASSGDEILNLNKKARKTMGKIKHGIKLDDVIIQEGVQTITKIDDKFNAEPVLYCSNGEVIDIFYRFHKEKGGVDNLNSVGAEFTDNISNNFDERKFEFMYKTMGKLSLFATKDN